MSEIEALHAKSERYLRIAKRCLWIAGFFTTLNIGLYVWRMLWL